MLGFSAGGAGIAARGLPPDPNPPSPLANVFETTVAK